MTFTHVHRESGFYYVSGVREMESGSLQEGLWEEEGWGYGDRMQSLQTGPALPAERRRRLVGCVAESLAKVS